MALSGRFFLILIIIVNGLFSEIIYVDSASVALNADGRSWEKAFVRLQDGLKNAGKNDEIRIAGGTYYTSYRKNREDHFILPSDIKIYGGFRRKSEIGSVSKAETILSADFMQDDSMTSDSIWNNKNNGYRVVVCEKGNFVEIDGVTIQGGYGIDDSNGHIQFMGSGLYLHAWNEFNNAKVRLNECKVQFNICTGKGAGAYFKGSTCEFEKCIFSGNKSTGNDKSASMGGGLYIDAFTANVNNCTIKNNSAIHGGGLFFNGVVCTSINNTFVKNRSFAGGGAIRFTGNNLVVENNDYEENLSADGTGGALAFKGRVLKMTQCLALRNNSYGSGGVVDFEGDTCYVYKSEFVNNKTDYYGGVFKVSGKKMSFDSCKFLSNTAKLKNGGVFHCEGDSLIIKRSIFESNCAANGYGGVIHYIGKQADITDNKFTKNSALAGGVLYAEQDVFMKKNGLSIKECVFTDNRATESGNALCFYGNANIKKNTFTTNNIALQNTIDNRIHNTGDKVWYMGFFMPVDSIRYNCEIKAVENSAISKCNFVSEKIINTEKVLKWYGSIDNCTYNGKVFSRNFINKNNSISMINK